MIHDTSETEDDPAAARAPLGFGRHPVPDPIDAAIERHRAAWNELGVATRAVDAAMSAAKQAEAEARADAAFDAAAAADGAAWADLLATRPRDVPAAVRLLRYVSASPETEVVPDPQDLLRQLTAAVEAAEAGGRSESATLEPSEPGTAAEPDPVFAAIDRYRATWDALTQARDAADGAEGPAAVVEAVCAAHDQFRAIRPTTAAGFRALAETWAWRLREERATPATGHDGVGTTIEAHAADSLIAGAGVCVPSAPARDWQAFAAGHPGFVPYPPHAPVLLIALDEAIQREAERYLDLAEAEIARSWASFAGCPDPYLWPQVERTMRRELRTDALALVAAALPADDGAPDPVHALIEAHRSAYAAWDRASKGWTDMVLGETGYAAAQAAADELGAAERAAYRRLFSGRPTTLAGAVALASYLGEAIRRTRIDPDPTEGERALSTITAALYGLAPGGAFSGDAPATVSAPHPDEALFTLGADFLASWVAEARIGDEAAYEVATAIMTRILAAPVATVAGLGIKALLLARLSSEGSSPLVPEPPQGPPGSLWDVLRQVQEGAARLADATAPVGLAVACAWAAAHEARINAPGGSNGLSEAQLEAALKACDGVWDRAIAEPSASPADVAAKARLLLPDAERRAGSADACRDDRLVPVILREIAGLGDAT